MIVDERYEVLQLLGEGGMGCVYRVRHRVLGRLFALKALKPELASDWVTSERFVQEARAAAAISHPNIVTINDFGLLETGQPYFVMELLEGRTLSSLLRERGALSTVEVLLLARQVASALGAAHDAGIIHRDLKPDNVVIVNSTGSQSHLKVLDFGLAMVHGNQRLTRDGVVFGTPQYMSPEQASGEALDARVDVYALGIVMYEALTGHAPFEAESYMGVLTQQLYAEPRPPSEVVQLSPAERPIERVILRCLSKSRDSRYASMSELLADLNSLLGTLAPSELADSARLRSPSVRPPMDSIVRRRRRRNRLGAYAFIGTLSLLLALGALYAYLVSASKTESSPAPAATLTQSSALP
jgi:serine/threonine-protein kinase